jgi:glycerophosphoryl diester phosphodiesterase
LRPNAPDWLVARPIAHRGLHDAASGVIENTLPAFEAAIARGFAIECDARLSADGEAFVFHDATLQRLTFESGAFDALGATQLRRARLRGSDARIPSLRETLTCVAGRAPLILEIKSAFDDDMRLADGVLREIADYPGPLALKSFDPAIIAHYRLVAAPRPLGIVAEAHYDDPYWRDLSAPIKAELEAFSHYARTRPDFLSFNVAHLPAPAPILLRALRGVPVMAWTVRTPEAWATAAQWADQAVFEGEPPG